MARGIMVVEIYIFSLSTDLARPLNQRSCDFIGERF